MEWPFELPVRLYERGNSFFREIHDKNNGHIAELISPNHLDYIVQAINSHKKLIKLLRDSTNILTGLMQEHQIIDTDCPTTFSHHILQKLTRQRKANKQALKEEAEKPK